MYLPKGVQGVHCNSGTNSGMTNSSEVTTVKWRRLQYCAHTLGLIYQAGYEQFIPSYEHVHKKSGVQFGKKISKISKRSVLRFCRDAFLKVVQNHSEHERPHPALNTCLSVFILHSRVVNVCAFQLPVIAWWMLMAQRSKSQWWGGLFSLFCSLLWMAQFILIFSFCAVVDTPTHSFRAPNPSSKGSISTWLTWGFVFPPTLEE